jgi:large repetitive protein
MPKSFQRLFVTFFPALLPLLIYSVGSSPSGSRQNALKARIRSAWPKAGSDAQNTSRGTASGASGRLQWIYNLPNSGDLLGGPVIGSDGCAYFSDSNGRLIAVNHTGALRWVYSPGGIGGYSPCLGPNDTIYVGGYDGILGVTSSGRLKWKAATTSGAVALTVDAVGTIYCGSRHGVLYAVSRKGHLLWSKRFGGPLWVAPAVGRDGTLYFGSGDHNVYAVSSSGQTLWTFRTRWKVMAAVTLGDDGTVFAPSGDGTLYALSPTGKLRWLFDTKHSSLLAAGALGRDGTYFLPDSEGTLYAITGQGRVKWHVANCCTATPAIGVDGTIFVARSAVTAIRRDGRVAWTVPLKDSSNCPLAIGGDGCVYVLTDAGALYAID